MRGGEEPPALGGPDAALEPLGRGAGQGEMRLTVNGRLDDDVMTHHACTHACMYACLVWLVGLLEAKKEGEKRQLTVLCCFVVAFFVVCFTSGLQITLHERTTKTAKTKKQTEKTTKQKQNKQKQKQNNETGVRCFAAGYSQDDFGNQHSRDKRHDRRCALRVR